MNRRSFFQHAAAAIATVAIGIKLQAPLPNARDLVAWKSWNCGAILNRGWKARIISGPLDYGPVAVIRDEHGGLIRAISAQEFYAT